MKTLTSIRLPELTASQIEALKYKTGLGQSEIITTAIDRMYREEIKMSNKNKYVAWVINDQGASEDIKYQDNTNAKEIYAFARRKYGSGWTLHIREIGANNDAICVTLR